MKTLFLKSNLLHIRTNEGEFEVINPEVAKNYFYVKADISLDQIEWPYGVELIDKCVYWSFDGMCHKCKNGSHCKKLARLLPKEEFKPAQPTPNFPKGGTTFTESAYKEFEGKDLHIVTPESPEPEEKMSYWQYQQFAEAAITQLKDRNETLESENKALREEQERCLKALEQLANYNKNLLEEIERLKAEVLKEKFPEN